MSPRRCDAVAVTRAQHVCGPVLQAAVMRAPGGPVLQAAMMRAPGGPVLQAAVMRAPGGPVQWSAVITRSSAALRAPPGAARLAVLMLVAASLAAGPPRAAAVGALRTNETEAALWLEQYDRNASAVLYESVLAGWTYNTNMTDDNERSKVDVKRAPPSLMHMEPCSYHRGSSS